LNYYKLDLISFLGLLAQDISDLLIKFLASQKLSKQYKNLIFSTIKHVCEMNDIVLNWKKVKKFVNSERTDNQCDGKDRAIDMKKLKRF
jgi:hypothetical protein